MYEFWYDCVKPKYNKKANLSYMGTVKTENVYENIAKDVEKRFDTWNYVLESLLPKGIKKQKVQKCVLKENLNL